MPTPQEEKPYSEYDNFAFHPYNVMLFLSLFAISALFIALSAAFIYTRVQSGVAGIRIPLLFGFNTLVLLASSHRMMVANRCYRTDDTLGYQRALRATMWLSVGFLALQILAWGQLFRQNILMQSDNSAAYLYLLSILHFLHVVAGIPFLWLFLRAARKQMQEPVTVLVYFSDPEKRLRLRLLTIYWHFLDGLWIFLVLFLLANYLI